MRLSELWRTRSKPTVSFELFPAHAPRAQAKLDATVEVLARLEPELVSVTFGAGGSTREGSRQLVASLRARGLEVLPYFAGWGLGPAQIVSVLDGYLALGVENLLVVRGDPPEEEGLAPAPDAFPHASDLLGFVRARYPFCLGAAGYPEGHREAESREADLAFLRLKQERGAEFVIAQYFYDNHLFLSFRERCREAGITLPIIPGVMPIYSAKLTERLSALCGASLPEPVRRAIAAAGEDKDALQRYGVELAVEQCRGLCAAGVPGLHFYTMDRSESVLAIVTRLREERLL